MTEKHASRRLLQIRDEACAALSRLEEAGLLVNAIAGPFTGRHGLRIGLSEVTRRGLTERIADFIAAALHGHTSRTALRDHVAEMSAAFAGLAVCDPPDAKDA